MMNSVREKLVELLDKAETQYLEAAGSAESDDERYAIVENAYGFYADYLIANGVTVQEWIPASEPPETNGCYLVAGNLRWDGKPMTREAYWNGEDWLSCYDKSNITRRITHWMCSPTPPKGE